MSSADKAKLGDFVGAAISPPAKQKEYGAVLTATDENITQVAESAVLMKKITGLPVLIILTDGGK